MIVFNEEVFGVVTVSQTAQTRRTPSGTMVSSFSARVYGMDQKYVEVECWRELVYYAEALEKGDKVLVSGDLRRDDYRSDKSGVETFKIIANYLHAQDTVAAPVAEEPSADPSQAYVERNKPQQESSEWDELRDDEYDPFPD